MQTSLFLAFSGSRLNNLATLKTISSGNKKNGSRANFKKGAAVSNPHNVGREEVNRHLNEIFSLFCLDQEVSKGEQTHFRLLFDCPIITKSKHERTPNLDEYLTQHRPRSVTSKMLTTGKEKNGNLSFLFFSVVAVQVERRNHFVFKGGDDEP